MKGKIDARGVLCIKRAGTVKEQWCGKMLEEYCSDNCPLFSEPLTMEGGSTKILICEDRMLYFERDGFVDERKGG